MPNPDLETLAAEFEAAPDIDTARASLAADLLETEGKAGKVEAGAFGSTDGVIGLVDRVLPGWTITIEGQARQRDGHWNVHLRRSDDPDYDDEVIGSGKGPTLRLAMLAAMMRVVAYRAKHHPA